MSELCFRSGGLKRCMCRTVCLQNPVRMGLCALCGTVDLDNFVSPSFHKAILSPDWILFILAMSLSIVVCTTIHLDYSKSQKFRRKIQLILMSKLPLSGTHALATPLPFCHGTTPHRKFLSPFWQVLFFPKCSTQVTSCLEIVLLRCLSWSGTPIHLLNSLSQDVCIEIQACSIFILVFIVLRKTTVHAEAAKWSHDCSF